MKVQIITILVILFVAITFEFFFEESLFNQSILFEKFIQNKLNFLQFFFKFCSNLGEIFGHLALFMIVFLFFPLSYIYNYSLTLIYSPYLTSIAKIINGDRRPFLDDNTLFQVCTGDFGNPSGHALCSTACYLAFAQLVIDFNKLDKNKKIMAYSCAVIMILLINFSRLILAVHSIDQVIFGDILGFSLYYLLFQVLEVNKINSKEFFQSFTDIIHTIKVSVFWFLCLFTLIACGFIFPLKDINYLISYEQVVLRLCPNLKKSNMLVNQSIFEALIIFAYMGMYVGLSMLSYLCSEKYPEKYEEINLFNKNNKLFYSKYILLGTNLLPFILYWLVPYDSNLKYIFTLKIAVPCLAFSFLSFGLNMYYYIKLGYANQDIYNANIKQLEQDENDYNRM